MDAGDATAEGERDRATGGVVKDATQQKSEAKQPPPLARIGERVRLWDIGYDEIGTLRTIAYALKSAGAACVVEAHTDTSKIAVYAEARS